MVGELVEDGPHEPQGIVGGAILDVGVDADALALDIVVEEPKVLGRERSGRELGPIEAFHQIALIAANVVAAGEQHSPLLVRAQGRPPSRTRAVRDAATLLVVAAAGREVGKPLGKIEGAARHDVDVATDRVAFEIRSDRLDDLDDGDEIRRDHVQRDPAPFALRRADEIAVDRDVVEVRVDPAHDRISALALVELDRQAGQPLDSLRRVEIG